MSPAHCAVGLTISDTLGPTGFWRAIPHAAMPHACSVPSDVPFSAVPDMRSVPSAMTSSILSHGQDISRVFYTVKLPEQVVGHPFCIATQRKSSDRELGRVGVASRVLSFLFALPRMKLSRALGDMDVLSLVPMRLGLLLLPASKVLLRSRSMGNATTTSTKARYFAGLAPCRRRCGSGQDLGASRHQAMVPLQCRMCYDETFVRCPSGIFGRSGSATYCRRGSMRSHVRWLGAAAGSSLQPSVLLVALNLQSALYRRQVR